ncbi:MAG: imidazole glycerol phosphate synthase subunit HisH [Candidatus Odinarchaeota archaeon]
MNIGIVNNGLGNVGSVLSAFKFYKYNVNLATTPKSIKNSDIIVLAGVGNFKTAVSKLKNLNLWDVINEEVLEEKKPLLGICLGMQLFADISYEDGETEGFGWLNGKVYKIEGKDLRVPHIGWNEVKPLNTPIFDNIRYFSFYYMHSYHLIPEDRSVVIAVTQYGDLELVAAVKKENIIGVQFHPEKSQGDGLRLFKNVIEAFQ